MNNTTKIIIAGGTGTIVQKAFGLSGFSLTGFTVFMVVFVALRFLLDAVFLLKKLYLAIIKKDDRYYLLETQKYPKKINDTQQSMNYGNKG